MVDGDMNVTLGRRVLGAVLYAGLGFIVGFVLMVGIGEPSWWLFTGVAVALFCGAYAAVFGDPWMRKSRRGAA